MSMSDRVAVMRNGVFDQIGTPREIFESPQTRFVADFMEASNIFSGRIADVSADSANDSISQIIEIETEIGLRVISRGNQDASTGAPISFSIRPEAVQVVPRGSDWSADNKFDGRIVEKIYLGDVTELEVALTDNDLITSRIQSRIDQECDFKEDAPVSVGWGGEDCNLLSD